MHGFRGTHQRGLRTAPNGFAAALALLAATACGPKAPADPRPNVVLVTIDTLRADRMGTYGYALPTTPQIDRLAAAGVVFERAIAAASTTAPAHASMMTSQYTRGHSIGHNNGGTKLIDETLAARFRAAGYQTGAFVGNLMLQERTGFDVGFDVFDGELPEAEGNRALVYERTAPSTTERALAWLDDVGDGPFFLWVHYQDPHGPYTPPEPFRGRLQVNPDGDETPLPVLPGDDGQGGIPAYQALPGLARPSEYESLYADEILYADHFVGILLDAVDAHDSGRPAAVLLTADHGESLGEMDRWFSHGFSTLPSLAHVPMILRAPGLTPERRKETVSHVDVSPTLLEIAGLPLPEARRGVALGPVIRGEAALEDRLVFADIGVEVTAYQDSKLVRVTNLRDVWNPQTESAAGPESLWRQYYWRADGSWAVVANDEALRAPIRAYLDDVVPMETTPLLELDALERQRLQALGYEIK